MGYLQLLRTKNVIELITFLLRTIPRVVSMEIYLESLLYRSMHFSAKRGIAIVYCPSVCPSVTFRYSDHIGWNSSKIISRPNSLRPLLWLTPNMGDLVHREHPHNWGGIGVGSGAQKTCNISETVQDRTKVTITD